MVISSDNAVQPDKIVVFDVITVELSGLVGVEGGVVVIPKSKTEFVKVLVRSSCSAIPSETFNAGVLLFEVSSVSLLFSSVVLVVFVAGKADNNEVS